MSLRLPVANLMLIGTPVAIIIVLLAAFLPQESAKQISTESVAFSHFCLIRRLCGFVYGHRSISIAGPSESKLSTIRLLGSLVPPLETMERLLIAMLWWACSFVFVDRHRLLLLEDIMAQRVAHHVVITTLSWLTYVIFCRPNCIQLARDSCSSMGLGSFFFAGFRVCGK